MHGRKGAMAETGAQIQPHIESLDLAVVGAYTKLQVVALGCTGILAVSFVPGDELQVVGAGGGGPTTAELRVGLVADLRRP